VKTGLDAKPINNLRKLIHWYDLSIEVLIMHKVNRVNALSNYRLHVEFDDGTTGEIDLSDRLFGPVFEPLRDEVEFQKVTVDEFGAIAWPCGADLAPDAIYQRLTAHVTA
jgi:hypothetical protein